MKTQEEIQQTLKAYKERLALYEKERDIYLKVLESPSIDVETRLKAAEYIKEGNQIAQLIAALEWVLM